MAHINYTIPGNSYMKINHLDYASIFFFIYHYQVVRVMFMVFSATFNYISVISWRSVLLVEETGVPGY
jgi:hypothetical protein